jgi:hypothetical protein
MTNIYETNVEIHKELNDIISAIFKSMPMSILLFTNSLIKHENGYRFFDTMDILSFFSSAVTIIK